MIDIPGLLNDSRINLSQSIFRIQSLERSAPRIAAQERGRLLGLLAQQRRIESISGVNPDPNLGAFFIIPLIFAGMGLAALGTWTWKHHEEVALERKRLELYDDCVKAKMERGASAEEAQHTCMEIQTGGKTSLADQLSNLMKTTVLAGVTIGVLWWVIRRK